MSVKAITLAAVWFVLTILVGWFLFTGFMVFLISRTDGAAVTAEEGQER